MTVMDNLAGEQKAIKAEHGLSFYVETGDMRILFDFGAGRHALENALRLGIRPERPTLLWEATGTMTMLRVTGILWRQVSAVPWLRETVFLKKSMQGTA